jgi:hypothetical protein
MTEVTEPTESHRFDVAVSFAGEDRELVDEIVGLAKAKGIRVFYDEDFRFESWGRDLIEYFTDVYQHQARYAVMFISSHYAEKVWTRQERRSILSRALNDQSEYALPVRLDDTALDGLLPTVGYLDARREGVAGIATAIAAKVSSETPEVPSKWTTGVPRDDASTQALLALKPPGWEYLYYGGLLVQGEARLRPGFLDMQIGYAKHRAHLDGSETYRYLESTLGRYGALADMFGAVLAQSVQDQSFGLPGEPGDPQRIAHAADRLLDVYDDFLRIVGDIRGTVVPEAFVEPRDLLAQWGVKPTESIQAFFGQFAAQVEGFPEKLLSGEDIHLEMVLKLETEDELMARFRSALEATVATLI